MPYLWIHSVSVRYYTDIQTKFDSEYGLLKTQLF